MQLIRTDMPRADQKPAVYIIMSDVQKPHNVTDVDDPKCELYNLTSAHVVGKVCREFPELPVDKAYKALRRYALLKTGTVVQHS
jgi:hypothetical protein